MSCDVGEVTERLENELCYDYNYELCSFSNLSVTSTTSQLIFQPFRCFNNVTTHSPTLPSLYLRHSSFSNPSVASHTSQLIHQPFSCFSYVTVHSPSLPFLYLRHSSFSNPYVALPTSQFILKPFSGFSCVTSSSLNSPGEPPEIRLRKLKLLRDNALLTTEPLYCHSATTASVGLGSPELWRHELDFFRHLNLKK